MNSLRRLSTMPSCCCETCWPAGAPIKAAKEIGGGGYPITYLGAFCGLRRSEVLGLRFLDVRWFDNEIRIQYTVSKRRCRDGVHKREWYLGPPKSRKSLRGISATESFGLTRRPKGRQCRRWIR